MFCPPWEAGGWRQEPRSVPCGGLGPSDRRTLHPNGADPLLLLSPPLLLLEPSITKHT